MGEQELGTPAGYRRSQVTRPGWTTGLPGALDYGVELVIDDISFDSLVLHNDYGSSSNSEI